MKFGSNQQSNATWMRFLLVGSVFVLASSNVPFAGREALVR
jgi:hypothetical protein